MTLSNKYPAGQIDEQEAGNATNGFQFVTFETEEYTVLIYEEASYPNGGLLGCILMLNHLFILTC